MEKTKGLQLGEDQDTIGSGRRKNEGEMEEGLWGVELE